MTIRCVVFDAYGTMFDVTGAAREAAQPFPVLAAIWPAFAVDWRRKQLEYTWLRSLLGDYVDFAQVTADSLDWTMEAHGLAGDLALRRRLLDLYQTLPPHPDAAPTLAALGARGINRAILSNGTRSMVQRAAQAAGLADSFEAILSAESVGIYKPAPRVYDLVLERFAVEPKGVLFVSSNGWDIAGAAAFGFRTCWINRGGLPLDRLPHPPQHVAPDLTTLTDILG